MRRGSMVMGALFGLMVPGQAFAQKAEFGTAAEARAMLEKVTVSMKADPSKTIAQINKGDSEFKEPRPLPVLRRKAA